MISTAQAITNTIIGMNNGTEEKGHLLMVLALEHINNGDVDLAISCFEQAAKEYDLSGDADCYNVANEAAGSFVAKMKMRKSFWKNHI